MEEKKEPQQLISSIGKHTEFIGNLSTKDNLVIYGQIIGDIKCDQNIELYGNVTGDVCCKNVIVFHAEIHGNVACDDSIKITTDSIIEGNISTGILESDGSIQGNIQASKYVQLMANSKTIGDIDAVTIGLENGACVQGCVQVGSNEIDN